MATSDNPQAPFGQAFEQMMASQGEALQLLLAPIMQGMQPGTGSPEIMYKWGETGAKLQRMWLDFQATQAQGKDQPFALTDPQQWIEAFGKWAGQMPQVDPAGQLAMWQESMALWQDVLTRFANGAVAEADAAPELPRKDRRFADPRWSGHPAFALIHQTYLMMAERIAAMADTIEGIDPAKREQLRFATKVVLEATSPANFIMTNPVVLERTRETGGENLVKGLEHLIADLKKGQLTHTDPDAFRLGENIAATPGKVVFETALYQLIQYSPTTEEVLETPLVIFPPWINRFYILDLNPQKSFIRWAVEQGVTCFVVSWKSADATMREVVWDDYIRAQIEAIDHVRSRLAVPAVHTIGYCVAGTTLAATLAILARRGEADRVRSATFFTAQVDFSEAGDLLHFVDDQQIAAIEQLSPDGYMDGRYMAATFNLLRGTDLIWNYWINNYLLGEDYPAFDLLHWNGDVTNLPARWHRDYLRDLYRDNRLVVPDSLSADGTPIDLTHVSTPAYIQAGKEDHIAPAESVWKITRHFTGPLRFVLAGSGHIAGVVNPPASKKYQYWTNDAPLETLETLEAFRHGAVETPGSWWPDWIVWLRGQDKAMVAAKGKRKPGGKTDRVIEDAPGRYVKTR